MFNLPNVQIIVRNSNIGGTWGGEEREGGLPLETSKGKIFDMVIVNEQSNYTVSIVL
jgi:hypothetical protein